MFLVIKYNGNSVKQNTYWHDSGIENVLVSPIKKEAGTKLQLNGAENIVIYYNTLNNFIVELYSDGKVVDCDIRLDEHDQTTASRALLSVYIDKNINKTSK